MTQSILLSHLSPFRVNPGMQALQLLWSSQLPQFLVAWLQSDNLCQIIIDKTMTLTLAIAFVSSFIVGRSMDYICNIVNM